jgi:hypothetical protein
MSPCHWHLHWWQYVKLQYRLGQISITVWLSASMAVSQPGLGHHLMTVDRIQYNKSVIEEAFALVCFWCVCPYTTSGSCDTTALKARWSYISKTCAGTSDLIISTVNSLLHDGAGQRIESTLASVTFALMCAATQLPIQHVRTSVSDCSARESVREHTRDSRHDYMAALDTWMPRRTHRHCNSIPPSSK